MERKTAASIFGPSAGEILCVCEARRWLGVIAVEGGVEVASLITHLIYGVGGGYQRTFMLDQGTIGLPCLGRRDVDRIGQSRQSSTAFSFQVLSTRKKVFVYFQDRLILYSPFLRKPNIDTKEGAGWCGARERDKKKTS